MGIYPDLKFFDSNGNKWRAWDSLIFIGGNIKSLRYGYRKYLKWFFERRN